MWARRLHTMKNDLSQLLFVKRVHHHPNQLSLRRVKPKNLLEGIQPDRLSWSVCVCVFVWKAMVNVGGFHIWGSKIFHWFGKCFFIPIKKYCPWRRLQWLMVCTFCIQGCVWIQTLLIIPPSTCMDRRGFGRLPNSSFDVCVLSRKSGKPWMPNLGLLMPGRMGTRVSLRSF